MRIVRFEALGNIKFGMIEGDVVRGFKGSPFETFGKAGSPFPLDGSTYKLSEVKLLSPCSPSKIIGVGLNSRTTIEKKNMPIPKVPIIFQKPSTSVIGPNDNIIYPRSLSSSLVYEGEVALVIGKKAKDVPEERAREYLLGVTCFNDVGDISVFEENRRDSTRTKGQDTFSPLGPWIETEIDPDNLRIEVYVNGVLRQSGSTNDFVFGTNKSISFVSSVMTLLPGDVIATGTPPGSDKMKPGDVVEVKVEEIGTLRNSVAGQN